MEKDIVAAIFNGLEHAYHLNFCFNKSINLKQQGKMII